MFGDPFGRGQRLHSLHLDDCDQILRTPAAERTGGGKAVAQALGERASEFLADLFAVVEEFDSSPDGDVALIEGYLPA